MARNHHNSGDIKISISCSSRAGWSRRVAPFARRRPRTIFPWIVDKSRPPGLDGFVFLLALLALHRTIFSSIIEIASKIVNLTECGPSEWQQRYNRNEAGKKEAATHKTYHYVVSPEREGRRENCPISGHHKNRIHTHSTFPAFYTS